MVRKHLVTMLAEWLTQLPDRHEHETRLLPFLLNGLNDPVQVWRPTPFITTYRFQAIQSASIRCKARNLTFDSCGFQWSARVN
jgi:hypothetical protein